MAMAIPLALAAALGRDSVPGAVAGAVFLLVLGLTGSRAGMLAGLAGIALTAFGARRRLARHRRTGVVVALLLISSIAVSEALALPGLSLYSRIDSLMTGTGLAKTRGLVWEGTLRAIRARPVTGHGPDTLRAVFMKYAPPGWASATELGMSERRAHCESLHLAATAGIPGLGMYIWLLVWVFRTGSGSRRQSRRNAGLASARRRTPEVAAVAVYLIHNLFSFGSGATAPIYWLLLGTLASPELRVASCELKRKSGFLSYLETQSSQFRLRALGVLSTVTVACALVLFAAGRFTADAYAYRGNEAGRAGDRDSEARYYGLAAQGAPLEPVYLVRRARALELSGAAAQALPLYEKAAALDPADGLKAGHVGRVRFALAESAGSREGMESALVQLMGSLDLAPSQPSLYGPAILAARRLGRVADETALVTRLRARDPGWALRMLGPER
jgi:hypothetical protein